MRNILEPQIVIDLTTNYRPINLLSTILVCAKVLTNIGKCGLGIDLKATSHSETLESNFLPTGPAKASGVSYFHPMQLKHDTEGAHLYVRGKPPTAVASKSIFQFSYTAFIHTSHLSSTICT